MSDSDDNNYEYSYDQEEDEAFENRTNLKQGGNSDEEKMSNKKQKRKTKYGGGSNTKAAKQSDRDYFVFQQSRAQLQEAYNRQVEEFNKYTAEFKQNHPRLTNFFFDSVDFVGRVGTETVCRKTENMIESCFYYILLL
jgi:hypothetical protein